LILESCAPVDAAADAAPAQAPPPAPDLAVLDEKTLNRIRELRKPGSQNLLAKMAGLYDSNSRSLIDTARACVASGDADGLAQAAHALRSSSSTIGATALVDLCSAMEAAGRAGTLDGVGALLERIAAEHGRVLKALNALGVAA
jgi:HPt (histidine-containing phosphotransfer) domain-containing protein